MYEKPRVNVKVEPRSTFTFTSDLPYIVSILFTDVKPVKVYVRTHVKITRQWKSTLRQWGVISNRYDWRCGMGRYNISPPCCLRVLPPTQSSKGIPHVVTSRVFATKTSVKNFIFPRNAKHVYFGISAYNFYIQITVKIHYNTV